MGPDVISIIARGDKPVYDWQHVAQLAAKPEDSNDIQPRQARANARLIAAAPDLLKALKRITEALGSSPVIWADEALEARAAIAKTEGRS
jgi:hypothetical protein